ncbi:mitochondrial calcium uniporter regulator 1-like [Liolophura sinensis]|uniref:mitochondrial calcium uniporter regulator 1-like n=1 Tax=Liolophura sinensis TaxID=3198878 RepID=UPI003158DBAA
MNRSVLLKQVLGRLCWDAKDFRKAYSVFAAVVSRPCSLGLAVKGKPFEVLPVCHMCSEARDLDLNRIYYYFDTHALVKKLQAAGFTAEQSETVTEALVHVVSTQTEQQNKILVTKAHQEITVQQLLANIASVKKDMLILEKSEFSALRNETEKQTLEINRMKQTVEDEVAKLRGQVSLDINLERSRAKEAHAEGEKHRAILNNRIDTEVANLRTIYEQYRNDILKYAGGTVLSCLTITLGFYRLWS